VNVEVVWGIDAQEMNIPPEFVDDEKAVFLYGRTLSSAEIACTIGHKRITERAKVDNVDFSVILEDDVQISDHEFVKSCLTSIEFIADPALFLLIDNPRLNLRLSFLTSRTQNFGVERLYSNPSPTSAYILNKKAIDRLSTLPLNSWKGVQADFPPSFFDEIKMYVINGTSDAILLQGASVIGERKQPERQVYRKFTRAINRLILSFGSRQMRYELGIRAYYAHFFARGLAWRLNRQFK